MTSNENVFFAELIKTLREDIKNLKEDIKTSREENKLMRDQNNLFREQIKLDMNKLEDRIQLKFSKNDTLLTDEFKKLYQKIDDKDTDIRKDSISLRKVTAICATVSAVLTTFSAIISSIIYK